MAEASDFKHEYNDNGTWHNALVKDHLDENNVDLTWQDDDGTWHFAKASRGDDPGQFRNKT